MVKKGYTPEQVINEPLKGSALFLVETGVTRSPSYRKSASYRSILLVLEQRRAFAISFKS